MYADEPAGAVYSQRTAESSSPGFSSVRVKRMKDGSPLLTKLGLEGGALYTETLWRSQGLVSWGASRAARGRFWGGGELGRDCVKGKRRRRRRAERTGQIILKERGV